MDRLNLGCFDSYLDGWVNLDIVEPADVVWDVTDTPWPFPDESFDVILAADILEHLPIGFFAAFVNECHRVLRRPGTLDIIVPTQSDNFWLDPTHVRPYLADTFHIFCRGRYDGTWTDIKAWDGVETTELARPQVPAVHARLTKTPR